MLASAILISGFCLQDSGQAQTTNGPTAAPPTTPQGFLQSVETYFTAFDTNSQTFSTNANYELWTGAAYQAGINLGAQFGIEARPIKKWPGLMLGSVSTLADTIGTIAQEEVDFGYSIRHYDVELTLGAGAVDTFAGGSAKPGFKGGVFAEVKKALSKNTFAGTRIEGLFGGKASQPIVAIFAGFTF